MSNESLDFYPNSTLLPYTGPQSLASPPIYRHPTEHGEIESPNWSKARRDVELNNHGHRKTYVIPASGALFIKRQPTDSEYSQLTILNTTSVSVQFSIAEQSLIDSDYDKFVSTGTKGSAANWTTASSITGLNSYTSSISAIYLTGTPNTLVTIHLS